jgi:hypothetical protein
MPPLRSDFPRGARPLTGKSDRSGPMWGRSGQTSSLRFGFTWAASHHWQLTPLKSLFDQREDRAPEAHQKPRAPLENSADRPDRLTDR